MDSNKVNFEKLDLDEDAFNHFRYEWFEGKYLVTNDFGNFHFLSPSEFKKFIQGELKEDSRLYSKLREKGFVKDPEKLEELSVKYAKRHSRLQNGPSLHIVVVTLRCNYNCIYCQASSKGMQREDLDMDKETAKKVVDRVFETTSDKITIEFQGGEPLVNWEVVKFIVEYGREKEKKSSKDLSFSLVTNLSLMDEKRHQFLLDHSVSICTSLDGPEDLHNKNRPYPDGNSYKEVENWLKKHRKLVKKRGNNQAKKYSSINALLTVSRFSLEQPTSIVNEYLKRGFHGIHLRPLSYLGYSGGEEARQKIGYSAEEFLEFWHQAMDYILKLNGKGIFFSERGSRIMLKKILTDEDPGFTDLASPCGAVIGQVVYDYNGDLYTCDEGRMLEDDTFKLGNVENTSYEEMITSDTCKTMINASTLENQACDLCAYKPYCGVCPVKNFALEGTLFPQMESTDWCKIKKAQFDYLFAKLRKKKYRSIFEQWIDRRSG